MANICLRSPQFKTKYLGASVESTICNIEIDGVLQYTLIKNKDTFEDQSTAYFDISELCRDYLEISYSGNNSIDTINITTTIINKDAVNGTGSIVGSPTTIYDVGFEAYGTYVDGVSPTNPTFRTIPTWFLAPDATSYSVNNFTIFVPFGESGYVTGVDSSGDTVSQSYSSSATVIQNSDINDDINIKRINCSKYGSGRKITFINKYGVQQDLWFSLKSVENIRRRNEAYKSNTLLVDSGEVYYNTTNSPVKTYSTNAKKSYTLSSGYYPQFANEYFEQLLMSEYVWLTVYRKENPSTPVVIPVKVLTSSIKLKTSLNDKLIEYTIEFEDAFDYLNNIR
jgi:hypothetical protein